MQQETCCLAWVQAVTAPGLHNRRQGCSASRGPTDQLALPDKAAQLALRPQGDPLAQRQHVLHRAAGGGLTAVEGVADVVRHPVRTLQQQQHLHCSAAAVCMGRMGAIVSGAHDCGTSAHVQKP